MSSHIKEGALAEWEKGIKDQMSFLADPDQHRKKMLGLAHEALRVRAIDSDQLSDMLELLDAARVWAEVELSEAERIGLFVGRTPEEGA
ncbi:hypothetical protein [Pseudomonas folii]|uniref:hypothetical protein n=1 Tax=Pseudomonas folii TaxID=2762593 RepID=UPI001FE2658B|nr:hypothetical protein [Pseudomonas folii]